MGEPIPQSCSAGAPGDWRAPRSEAWLLSRRMQVQTWAVGVPPAQTWGLEKPYEGPWGWRGRSVPIFPLCCGSEAERLN